MSPLIRTIGLLSCAWLGAVASPLAAQAPALAPDSLAPAAAAPAPAADEVPALKFSGYAGASYTYSTHPDGRTIVGRLYDRFHDSFVLNAFKLTVEHPFVATKMSAGFRADLLFGQNAVLLKSSGFDIGTNGDLEQLYVVLNFPTSSGNGVQFKFGKMVTLLGLEVIEDVANPNWSVGNQFNFVENLTSTGLELDLKLSSAVDIELRVDNGWDRLVVPDGHKSFMGRIGLVGGSTSLGVIGYAGNQQPDISAVRYGVQALLNQKFGKASLWVQADYGKEKANINLPDPTQDAAWWGLGLWLASDLSPNANLAVRGDYVNDTNGFRTSAFLGFPASAGEAHKLWSLTGTLNLKSWGGALVRPELLYDHSNLAVFDGETSQFTVALGVSYVY